MEFKIESGKLEVRLSVNDKGIVLIQSYYNGHPNRSQRGNLNMAWFPQDIFTQLCKKFLAMHGGEIVGGEEEIPF